MPRRFTPCFLFLGSLGCLLLFSCQIDSKTGKDAMTIIGKGVVNDPANKSLRFDMLQFGMREFCEELMLRGAPLRLSDGQPVIGRYFAEKCHSNSLDTLEKKSIIVQFGGKGFAWTAGTGRLGFRAQGLLELAPDFRVHEDAMYVYFRPIQVDTSDFELLMTEKKLATAVTEAVGIDEQHLGQSVIDAQLGRGFTAIRYDADGHTDFALGLVEPGTTPFRPFTVQSSPKRTLANGRTELFVGQQDYIGKLQVTENESITITLQVEGTPAIDFALLSEKTGTPRLLHYLSHPGALKMKGAPTFESTATSTVPTRAEIRVPAGNYYVILDHSSAWGQTTPALEALPARVDYLIQTGNAGKATGGL